MSMAMLAYCRPMRQRLMLRLNEDKTAFRIYNFVGRVWEQAYEDTYATDSIAIQFTDDGSRADIASHTGRVHHIYH